MIVLRASLFKLHNMVTRFIFKTFFWIGSFLLFTNLLIAQDLLKGKDLSQIKADAISAADIAKLKAQLSSSGMSPEQAEQMAIAKGLPASEAAKLKQRLNSNATILKTGSENTNMVRENTNPEAFDNSKEIKGASLINPIIFGSELYTSAALSFEPNLKLATPTNYVLGPDDQILVSVYGVQEYSGNLLISAEGIVSIPNVGEVKLAGLTIEAATQKLKTVMGNSAYSYLKSGGSKLSVTLSKIKTISITIIGSNRPGNYKVSSFSSVFNALFAAGGPSANGSFREIELIRNNKLVRKIDLYRFLLEGDQSDNIGLKDNDVIRIPTYKIRVELQGQVKRPGIFEPLPGETVARIIAFASGFTDTAYQASIKVFQRAEKDRQVRDLLADQYDSFLPKSGDVYVVSKILNRFQNRVSITGSVMRPDVYELTPSLHVADLIRKADGLKQDAFTERALVLRLKEDLTKSILSFDIKKALSGDTADNMLLQREDEVIISSVLDLKDLYKVSIQGEVRLPGTYDYVNKLTLKDLILQAGGFTDAAFKSVEIARLIKRDSLAMNDERSSKLIYTTLDESSMGTIGDNIILNPFDVITVRRMAGYKLPESITVSGQVQFPGPYTLSNIKERVSEVLKRAGGFAPDAFPAGAYIKRGKTDLEKERAVETTQTLQKNAKDSLGVVTREILKAVDKIPLDLPAILKAPGSAIDIILKANDELVIPKFDEQVRISGEVLLSTQVPYNSHKTFRDYISAAGGFSPNALRYRSYIVYANGRAATTSRFLFFKFYPTIEPGSEIVVPKKREKKATSLTEVVGLTTVLVSLVTTFVLLKK